MPATNPQTPMSPAGKKKRSLNSGGGGSGGKTSSSRSGGNSSRRGDRTVGNAGGAAAAASIPPPGPPLASLALKLTRQQWSQLSLNEADDLTAETSDVNVLCERVTALMLVRIVACVAVPGMFPDFSTTSICTMYISKRKRDWPKQITDAVFTQLQTFVRRILSGYHDQVPYHNRQHAYHVILSTNQLLDKLACCYTKSGSKQTKFNPPPSYGLRHNPMALLAVLFSALIHDVEHQGIPNRQLASENDRLAVLYNDQSIAENWSLYIAFSELLQEDFVDLREVLFGKDIESPAHAEKYAAFRKMVVSMVLSTDLASPERTQVVKSKWKEAFGVEQNDQDSSNGEEDEGPKRLPKIASSDDDSSGDEKGDNVVVNQPNMSGRVFRRWNRDSTMSELTLSTTTAPGGGGSDEDGIEVFDGTGGRRRGRSGSGDAENSSLNKNATLSAAAYSIKSPPPPALAAAAGANISPQLSHKAPEKRHVTRRSSDQPHPTTAIDKNNFKGAKDDLSGLTSASDHSPRTKKSSARSAFASSPLFSNTNSSSKGSSASVQGTSSTTGTSAAGGGGKNSLTSFLNKSHGTGSRVHGLTTGSGRFSSFSADKSHSGRGAHTVSSYRSQSQRLGILRTVDLGGETLETYSRHEQSKSSSATIAYSVADVDMDEPDELKMTVVMETILAAADVAHNLQSWQHMATWSTRLYMELRRAHVNGRGVDVSANWFDNQVGFLESYVLPLAKRLEETGVWGDEQQLPGMLFSPTVRALRDEWLVKGHEFTQQLIQQGAQQYPKN